MKINKESIEFDSDEHMFKKEKSGRKPNTVRILTMQEHDEVEKLLLTSLKPLKIIVHNYAFSGKPNGQIVHKQFKRTLTDISCCGDFLERYLYVFSWKHKEVA